MLEPGGGGESDIPIDRQGGQGGGGEGGGGGGGGNESSKHERRRGYVHSLASERAFSLTSREYQDFREEEARREREREREREGERRE